MQVKYSSQIQGAFGSIYLSLLTTGTNYTPPKHTMTNFESMAFICQKTMEFADIFRTAKNHEREFSGVFLGPTVEMD